MTNKIIQIRRQVLDYFRLKVKDFESRSRRPEHVIPRQIGHYLCCKIYNKEDSLKEIGEKIGKRDHATVLHSCKVIQDLLDTDFIYKGKKLRIIIDEIIASCNYETRRTLHSQNTNIFDSKRGKHINIKALIDNHDLSRSHGYIRAKD